MPEPDQRVKGLFMGKSDAQFGGSIPAIYDQHLGPLLFRPYAAEVARRACALKPQRILEVAAGTGLVTVELAYDCPQAEIVATDLNKDMLHVAKRRTGNLRERVQVRQADAQALPFGDAEFDLVVCQFGIMFFPDKVKANAEARRVLRDGGRYLLVIWDRLERNPAAQRVHEAMAALFPQDPPGFLARTPFGYSDPARIEGDLLAAGFRDIEFETVALESLASTGPEDASLGLVQGTPLRAEVEAHGPAMLERAEQAVRAALSSDFPRALSALVVTAIR
jgi:ubiquinone/menaquinone biosynthesis C-methylase UbiE